MGRYNFNQRTRDGYEISPEQAARWLERNDNNRNVNVAKVKKMAKDMREGHWDTTHQGIAIASDGTLVDGQHRLLAIVESGVTVRMNVTFNAAKSQHIDSGNIRSMANRVQMSDYEQYDSLRSKPHRPRVRRLEPQSRGGFERMADEIPHANRIRHQVHQEGYTAGTQFRRYNSGHHCGCHERCSRYLYREVHGRVLFWIHQQ